MDKYEFKLRCEEIDKLMEQQKYADAVRLADSIDWRRVKSASTLAKIAELYKLNKRFEECRDILEMAYDRNPGNRNVVYGLCEISLQFGDIVEAIEYFKEFAKLAPKDTGVYILRYRIYEAQNVGYEDRIEVLEELKKTDRLEEWEYELAYLYHRAGFATKCVEECDELILWFGDGPYVTKAMELKMLHEPLTPSQQEKYDRRNEEKIQIAARAAKERNTGEIDLEDDFRVKTIDMSKFNTMNLQAELAENLKEYINDEPTPVTPTGGNRESQQVYHNTIPADAQEVFFADRTADMRYQIPTPQNVANATPEMEAFKESFAQEYVGTEPPKSVGQLIEDLGEEATTELPPVNEQFMNESVAKSAETGKIHKRDVQEIHFEEESASAVFAEGVPHASAISATAPLQAVTGYERLLSQEKDGQISLAGVAGENTVEKQITGQLNIRDILADWEKLKKDREQKMQEEVRQKVLQQTGQIFTQYDVSSKTGILASLEDPSVFDKVQVTKEPPLENHAKQVIMPSNMEKEPVVEETAVEAPAVKEPVVEEPVVEEPVAEEPVVEALTAELVEAAAEETAVLQASVISAVEDTAEIVQEGTIVSQFTAEMSTSATAAEAEETVFEGFAGVKEGNFYGSVTQEIPGGIWKEVDGIVDEEPDTIQEEEPVEETNMQEENTAYVQESEAQVHKDLTGEEKELFKPFLYSKKMKKQILDTLEKISLAAYVGNVVITADSPKSALKLAKLIVSYIRMCDDNFSGNVAKIDAESLNKKDLSSVFAKLVNGALLIEGAGKLSSQTMRSLLQEMNQEATGIIVILMDKKRAIDTLMGRASVISEFFNARIDILSMNADMLVDYGINYVYQKGYSVDDMGRLALYKRISEMQAGNHTVTMAEVKELMEDAMDSANRGGLKKMTSILMKKRYDENKMIILKEKDFE